MPSWLSRREFMQRTSADAALALTPLGALLVQQAPRPRWKVIAFSKPFTHLNFTDTADLVADVGWDGIECPVRLASTHIQPDRVEDDLPKMVEALKTRGRERTPRPRRRRVIRQSRCHRGLFLAGTFALLFSTAAACGGRSPVAPATAPTSGSAGWTLVFADEFDTPGALASTKWGYEIGYIRNDEKQFYTSRSENVRAEGGNLVIEGRQEAYQGFGYTSASINTLGRFEFLYGRVEVRAKLPTGNGAWPAIWMLGTNRLQVGWPTCGEIDIMENVGFDPLRIHGTIHTAAYNHTIGTQKTASVTIANPWEDFHVYAMEWHADHVDVFVDGQKYFSFPNDGGGTRAWPFDKPQYLLVNLAIGGSWGGQKGIDDSRFPQRYLVDYVRVYQQK